MKKRTGVLVFFATALIGILVMWLASALRPRRKALPPGTLADYVLIEKRSHRLTLFFKHRRLKAYRVALGRGGLGPKLKRGDARTPEGLYRVEKHISKKKYRHSLKLDFPSEQDVAMAKRRGARMGGDVLIHGLRNGLGWVGHWHRAVSWTNGSVGLTNDEMDELYHVIPDGTPVEIRA
ncbi:MAG: L,D-transpeptidase family protein [Rhizomicrobium sp.]